MAQFAQPADMLTYYSPRLLGDTVSDGGVRVSESDLLTNTVIAAALKTATGRVKAMTLQGNRYTVAQLEALQDDSSDLYDEDSASYLTELTCRVAFWVLWQRKPWADSYQQTMQNAKEEAEAILNNLRTGVEIFAFDTAAEAGTPTSRGVTAAMISSNTLWSEAPRGRFYPPRRNIQ